MVYPLNIKSHYGYGIGVDIVDDRYDNRGSMKPELRPEIPRKDDGTPDFGAATWPWTPPRSIKWKDKSGRRMPDFHAAHGLNVSSAAHAIIERFEPGVHRFAPVECIYSRGKTVEQRYWLKAGRTVDALDPKASNMVLVHGGYVSAKTFNRLGKVDVPAPSWLDASVRSTIVLRPDQEIGRANV